MAFAISFFKFILDLSEKQIQSCYWRATYLVASAQLAEVSAVVKAVGGAVLFILTTASVLEQ